MSQSEIALEFFCSIRLWSFGKFLEIVERFNLVLVALGKGSCRVRSLGKFLEGSIFLGTLGKGSCRVSNVFLVTLGKGSLEIWDCSGIIFWIFWEEAILGKGVWGFEIAWKIFKKIGGKPWKRESLDLRLLWDYFFIFF